MFHLGVAKVDQGLHMLQWLHTYVASVCSKYFICFQTYVASVLIWMLHMFHTYVARVYVRNVSSVSGVCCKHFYLDVAHVSHICCKSMFEMFQLFQPYVAISVFMLQVASVLSGCCICFTHMLQVYVPNISSALGVCCIQVFHVTSVFMFPRYVQRVMGAQLGRWGKGHGEPGAGG